jgi:hypothetical protein
LVSPVGRQQPKGSPRRHAAGYPTEVGNPNRHRLTLSNPNAQSLMTRKGSGCARRGTMAAAFAAPSCRMATVASELVAHDRVDRTDGTDGSPTSHEETLAYYCELWHIAAVPGLRIRVSTRPRGGAAGLRTYLGPRGERRQAGPGVARPLRSGDHATPLRAPHHGRAGEGGGRARRGDAGRARGRRGARRRGRRARVRQRRRAGQSAAVAPPLRHGFGVRGINLGKVRRRGGECGAGGP